MKRSGRPPHHYFWRRVITTPGEDGCWLWAGIVGNTGYGLFSAWNGERVITATAHRAAWEFTHDDQPIPFGMFVCHKCDNKLCVRPSHLWLGTARDNTLDMVKKGRHARTSTPGRPKLNVEDVREIWRSKESVAVLSHRFGVKEQAIYRIRSGESWKKVTGELHGV